MCTASHCKTLQHTVKCCNTLVSWRASWRRTPHVLGLRHRDLAFAFGVWWYWLWVGHDWFEVNVIAIKLYKFKLEIWSSLDMFWSNLDFEESEFFDSLDFEKCSIFSRICRMGWSWLAAANRRMNNIKYQVICEEKALFSAVAFRFPPWKVQHKYPRCKLVLFSNVENCFWVSMRSWTPGK